MRMDRSVWLIIVSMLLGVVGQLFLKIGMNQVGSIGTINWAKPLALFGPIFAQPLVWLGLGFYGASSLLWLIVLSRFDLSYAYPMLASMYVILPVLSRLFLDESIPPLRWLGMVIVLVGVVLVSRG